MIPAESLAADVAQLVDGTRERAEYRALVIAHTKTCERERRRIRKGVPNKDDPKKSIPPQPGKAKHHACWCTRHLEHRAHTHRAPGLLAQLAAVAQRPRAGVTVPGATVPQGSPGWDADGALAPSRGGGWASRPPVNTSALELLADIGTGAAALRVRLRMAAGRTRGARTTTTAALREIVALVLEVDHDEAEHAARKVHSWARAARIALRYTAPVLPLKRVVCHACGGYLVAAPDASTDVLCAGIGTVEGPALEGEPWPVSYGPCGQTYPRHQWLALLDAWRPIWAAAAWTGRSERTIRTWIRDGRLAVACDVETGDLIVDIHEAVRLDVETGRRVRGGKPVVKSDPKPPGPQARTPEEDSEHFWTMVDKTGDCWLWTGCVLTNGYGQVRFGGRRQVAHRVAYELTFGPIPDGMQIDHMCCTKNCVRPDHLQVVTASENVRLANLRRAAS